MTRMKCQDIVDTFVKNGMSARYSTGKPKGSDIAKLDINTVLVYIHDEGQDVVLMGDNLIDTIRFKFRTGERNIRGVSKSHSV